MEGQLTPKAVVSTLAGRGREKEKVLCSYLEVPRNIHSAEVAMNMLLLFKILFYCILFPLVEYCEVVHR